MAVTVAPVDDLGGDQLLIRYQRIHPTAIPHHQVAGVDFLHPAVAVADTDDVAWPDRAIEQNQKTADQVAGNLLESKSDAHAERAADDGQCGQIESGSA